MRAGPLSRFDPVTGDAVDPVTPLVCSRGSELGLRVARAKGAGRRPLALWQLDLASELLFVGDAGTTEASLAEQAPRHRAGAYWFADPRARLELEFAYTQSRFTDADPAGDRIPGAVPWIALRGLVVGVGARLAFVGARALHFRRRAAHRRRSRAQRQSSTMVNLAVGKRWQRWNFELDVLNALDSDDHDINYFYASRLPGEAGRRRGRPAFPCLRAAVVQAARDVRVLIAQKKKKKKKKKKTIVAKGGITQLWRRDSSTMYTSARA